jgi:hypothetical protein
MALLKPHSGLLGHSRAAAEQIDATSALGREVAAVVHEVHARHPLGQGSTLESRRPDERHPIGDRQVGAVQRGAELRIALGDADEVEVDGHHLVRRAARREVFNPLYRFGQTDLIDERAA